MVSKPYSHDLSVHRSRNIGDLGVADQVILIIFLWKSGLQDSTGIKLQMLMIGGIQQPPNTMGTKPSQRQEVCSGTFYLFFQGTALASASQATQLWL